MTKTRLEVIAMAHREIEVLSADESPTADQEKYAGDVLDSLFAELTVVEKMPFTWTLEETPDAAFMPLSLLLAADIAQHYGRPAKPRARAMGRLRAFAFPDDRADARDLDEDGTISAEEADASARSLYY